MITTSGGWLAPMLSSGAHGMSCFRFSPRAPSDERSLRPFWPAALAPMVAVLRFKVSPYDGGERCRRSASVLLVALTTRALPTYRAMGIEPASAPRAE